jgi:hypothetical protein
LGSLLDPFLFVLLEGIFEHLASLIVEQAALMLLMLLEL